MLEFSQLLESWYKDHTDDLAFAFQMTDNKRPANISIRYDAVGSRYLSTPADWFTFKCMVTEKSNETMCVTTDEKLFNLGIINIAVACQNRNFQSECIIDTLKWIRDDFFPSIDILDDKRLDFLIKIVTVENTLNQPQRFVIEEYDDHILLKKLLTNDIG